MEKSFLSYPSWEPNAHGKEFLSNLRNFREQKLQLRTTATYQHLMTHHLASNSRDRGYIPPHYGYMRSSPVAGYRLGSMGLIDPDENNHPYLLDWYYTSWSSSASNASVEVANSPAEVTVQVDDFPIDMTTESGQRFEEGWSYPSEERLKSHYEASSSNSNFRESTFRQHNTGHVVHPSESRWWMRTCQNLQAPQASFIEPPAFGQHNNAAMHDNSADLGNPAESHMWVQSGANSQAPQTSFIEPPPFGQHIGAVIDDKSSNFGHPTESHWWGRTCSNYGAVQTSFLEPPIFFAHDTKELVQDNSDGITEQQDQFLDWRNFGKSQNTFYIDDNDTNGEFDLPFTDPNGEFNLPFDDIYHTSLRIPKQ